MNRFDARQTLFAGHDSPDVEKSEPPGFAGWTFDTFGVRHATSQHLITAAEAEHMSAAAMVRQDIDVPALRAQEGEIAAGRLGAGKDDKRSVARNRLARRHHHKVHVALELERIEIVEIRDPFKRKIRDFAPAGLACLAKSQRVFRGKLSRPRKVGQHPKAAPAGACFDQPVAVTEQ